MPRYLDLRFFLNVNVKQHRQEQDKEINPGSSRYYNSTASL